MKKLVLLIIVLLTALTSAFADGSTLAPDIAQPDWDAFEKELLDSIPPPPQSFYVVKFKGADGRLIDEAIPMISKVFFGIPFIILDSEPEIPREAYVDVRDKYYAGTILDALEKMRPPGCLGIIGFVDVPIFVGRFPRVNGIGNPEQNAAVVSFDQLRDSNRILFLRRVVGESLHELGHLFSFDHCASAECALSAANSLPDLDARGIDFCPAHLRNLYLDLNKKGVELPPWEKFYEEKKKEWTTQGGGQGGGAQPTEPWRKAAPDTEPPVVVGVIPENGAVVPPKVGPIIVRFDDPHGGVGVDPATIRILLNGAPLDVGYHTGRREAAAWAGNLQPGAHSMEIHAADLAGNTMNPVEFSFTVKEN